MYKDTELTSSSFSFARRMLLSSSVSPLPSRSNAERIALSEGVSTTAAEAVAVLAFADCPGVGDEAGGTGVAAFTVMLG